MARRESNFRRDGRSRRRRQFPRVDLQRAFSLPFVTHYLSGSEQALRAVTGTDHCMV